MKKRTKKFFILPLLVMAFMMAIIPVVSTSAAPPEYVITTISEGSAPNWIYGINASGDLVGCYFPTGPGISIIDGKLETFTRPEGGTTLIGIGPSGEIVGDYAAPGQSDTFYHWHGFMITKFGEYIPIDDGIHDTLVPWRVLPDGSIVGHVQQDPSNPFTRHGFVMRPNGSFEYNEAMPFSQHNSATPDRKIIVGSYLNMSLGKFCGYVLENGIQTATFDIPGSSITLAFDINPAGDTVVGWYMVGPMEDPNSEIHGYIAQKQGEGNWEIVKFDVPGASRTLLNSISPAGELAGPYIDGTGVHGFVASKNHRK